MRLDTSGVVNGTVLLNVVCGAAVLESCHRGPVTGIAVDAMNATVVTASTDGTVRLWNFETHVLDNTIDVGSPVTHIEICKDSGMAKSGVVRGWRGGFA